MTFEYRDDATCDKLVAQPDTDDDRKPVVFLSTTGLNNGVYVPLDRVEEVVAGIRDAARTAAGDAEMTASLRRDGFGDDEIVDIMQRPITRTAARQTTGQDDTTAHIHRLGNSDEDGGLMDDWDNCLDPNCPGPSAQEREAALTKRGLAAPAVGQPDPVLERLRLAATQWRLAHAEGDLSVAWDEAAVTVLALIDNPNVTWTDLGFTRPAITGHAVVAPAVGQPAEAHDTDSSVRNVIEHALTVYYQDSSAPSAIARAILAQHHGETLREAADFIDKLQNQMDDEIRAEYTELDRDTEVEGTATRRMANELRSLAAANTLKDETR